MSILARALTAQENAARHRALLWRRGDFTAAGAGCVEGKGVRVRQVRLAPLPPKRALIALPPAKGQAAPDTQGSFTLLTYNLLADLYATVAAPPSLGLLSAPSAAPRGVQLC